MKLRLASISCAQAALSLADTLAAEWCWALIFFAVGFGLAAWRAS